MKNFIALLPLFIAFFSSSNLLANKKTPTITYETAVLIPFDNDTFPTISNISYAPPKSDVNKIPTISNVFVITTTSDIHKIPTISNADHISSKSNVSDTSTISNVYNFSYDYEGISPKIAPSTKEDVKLMPIEGEIDDLSIMNLEVETKKEASTAPEE